MKAVLRAEMTFNDADIPGAEHQPVMLETAVELLGCKPAGVFVDATLGLGGHAAEILRRIQPGGLLIGLDRDLESLELARARLQEYKDNLRLLHENFKNLPLVLNNLGISPIDGILLDLGVSSYQLLSHERGFSFHADAMLDMRLDRSQRLTAANLVNELSREQLADVIYKYGEERFSRKIAAAIVAARGKGRITRCSQLAEIVSRAVGFRGPRNIHPATRTFQALRIAVNQELEGLEAFFSDALSFLRPGGRIVAISFHSLEDRLVKRAFRMLSGKCVCGRGPELCICPRQQRARILTGRSVTASEAELASNPRARSARLRALERI